MTKLFLDDNSTEPVNNNSVMPSCGFDNLAIQSLIGNNIKPRFAAFFKTGEEENLAMENSRSYLEKNVEMIISSDIYLKSREDFYVRNRTTTCALLKNTHFLFNNNLNERYIYFLDENSNLLRYKDSDEFLAVFGHDLLGVQTFLDKKEEEWLRELILCHTSRI